MDLLTLLPTLESIPNSTRNIVATNKNEAISYKGDITSVEINNRNIYNNINQICLLHTIDTLYLYINHTTRRTRAKYKLSDISSIVIT